METKWTAQEGPVVKYVEKHSLRLHPLQEKLIEVTQREMTDDFDFLGTPVELQLMANLVKTIKAKKTLDIGVFSGYSALTVALALPEDGKVVACDITDKWLAPGKQIWKEAGVEHKIDLRIAPAVDTLNSLIDNGESGTYDFAFIDADKFNYIVYYDLCKTLIRPGGIIGVDNVLWLNKVADPEKTDKFTETIRAFNRHLAQDESVDISMLAIADGITLAFKK